MAVNAAVGATITKTAVTVNIYMKIKRLSLIRQEPQPVLLTLVKENLVDSPEIIEII
jgi:hypothetical protein